MAQHPQSNFLNVRTGLLALGLLALGLAAAPEGVADDAKPRQMYGDWHYSSTQSYYYREYRYKSSASDNDYQKDYCVYKPSQPNYCYYYSTKTQQYWGRSLQDKDKNHHMEVLAEADRKKTLDGIPENKFTRARTLPTIPHAKDNEQMKLPPFEKPTKKTSRSLDPEKEPKDLPK